MDNRRGSGLREIGLLAKRSLAACLMALSLALPYAAPAYAEDYGILRMEVSAQVTDAGDIIVSEQLQLAAHGGAMCVRWPIAGPSEVAALAINGVSVSEATDAAEGESLRDLRQMPFEASWRRGETPEDEGYSWDADNLELYVFLEAHDAQPSISIDYTAASGVKVFADIGELDWRYLPAEREVDAQDVTATVSLPVPVGQQVERDSNVHAWGHGPLEGTVDFNDQGMLVFSDPSVKAGQYAEARIVFPAAWLPNASAAARSLHEGENHLQAVLDDELRWADAEAARRAQHFQLAAAWLLLSLVALGWALLEYRRWGRDYKPAYEEAPWQGGPAAQLPPAVVGRALSWNKKEACQFEATIASLIDKGIVQVRPDAAQVGREFPGESDLLMLAPAEEWQGDSDSLESAALELVFGQVSGGTRQVRLGEVRSFVHANPELRDETGASWHAKLDQEVEEAGIFEARGFVLRHAMQVVAACYLVATLLFMGAFGLPVLVLAAVPTALAIIIIAHFMPRRTQRGVDVVAGIANCPDDRLPYAYAHLLDAKRLPQANSPENPLE